MEMQSIIKTVLFFPYALSSLNSQRLLDQNEAAVVGVAPLPNPPAQTFWCMEIFYEILFFFLQLPPVTTEPVDLRFCR